MTPEEYKARIAALNQILGSNETQYVQNSADRSNVAFQNYNDKMHTGIDMEDQRRKLVQKVLEQLKMSDHPEEAIKLLHY